MKEKVADKKVGSPFPKPYLTFTVKCNLTFSDQKTAVALQRIVSQFETSALRR
jgi:hypothetical protein